MSGLGPTNSLKAHEKVKKSEKSKKFSTIKEKVKIKDKKKKKRLKSAKRKVSAKRDTPLDDNENNEFLEEYDSDPDVSEIEILPKININKGRLQRPEIKEMFWIFYYPKKNKNYYVVRNAGCARSGNT